MKTIQRHTALALALVNAVKRGDTAVEGSIIKAADKVNAGVVKEPSINAHLKHKTYKVLSSTGYMYR